MRRIIIAWCGFVAVLALPIAAQAAITGTAFMDYNSNGQRNAGGYTVGSSNTATDAGLGGVVVRAYDATGTQIATATTASDGSYTLPTSGSGTVRVQFEPPSGYKPSFVGADDATSVQFVSPNASGVDFGATRASQYCQDNPKLVSCQLPWFDNGGMTGAFTMPSQFLAPLQIEANGQFVSGSEGTYRANTNLTTAGALGATFGVGVDRQGNVYFGTFVKRHSPYGSAGGVNAIYKVNLATGVVSTFATLGINTLPAHSATTASGNAGALLGNAPWPAYSVDGLRADGNANDVFHLVGRAGLGDVDVSPDGSTLWAVEMTQAAPRLWKVPINGSGAGTTAGTPVPFSLAAPTAFGGKNCFGNWHPMALDVTDERVRIGGVCGAEDRFVKIPVTGSATSGTVVTLTTSTPHNLQVGDWVQASPLFFSGIGNNPYRYANQVTAVPSSTQFTYSVANAPAIDGTPDAGAYVIRFTEAAAFIRDVDPTSGAATTIAALTLDYPKAASSGNVMNMVPVQPNATGAHVTGLWQNWSDAVPVSPFDGRSPQAWPQPMLSNIETTPSGDLVLSFRDRYLDQSTPGAVDYESPSRSAPVETNVFNAAADMIRLCHSAGTYTMENNGACGSNVGASVPNFLGSRTPIRPRSPLYYYNGFYESGGTVAQHPYTSLGGTAQMPGSRTIWSTVWDPQSISTQGIRANGPCTRTSTGVDSCGPANSPDGAILGGGSVTDPSGTRPGGCGESCWQKGNGLGDLEIVCDAAPVQIGNRVWVDADGDGVQDPNEAPIGGVTVRLYDGAGNLAGTAITDADGTYYFTSNVSRPSTGNGSNGGGGLTAGVEFVVKLDNPADYAAGGPLAAYTLTSANATSPGNAANSKATMVNGFPTIAISARSAGDNDHTFDVGFTTATQGGGGGGSNGGGGDAGTTAASNATSNAGKAPTADEVLVAIGDTVWFDVNRNGLQGERRMRGVVVILLDGKGRRATDAAGGIVKPQRTDANGRYLFDGLEPGRYRVKFVLPAGYAFTGNTSRRAKDDSNPRPDVRNPLIGITPAFRVFARALGNTVPNTDRKLDASFIDPTIDAGVVRDVRVTKPSSVTG